MKVLWICGLLGLLSMVAYGRMSAALADKAVAPATVSSVGDDLPATDLSFYLQLHETRDANVRQVSARANACPG